MKRAAIVVAGLALVLGLGAGTRTDGAGPMQVKKVTPILAVEAIEPVLPCWVDRLGVEKTAEVPHGDRLGFVILAKDGLQIMYQTLESIAADAPQLASRDFQANSNLFIEVDDIDAVEAALKGIEPVVPRRKTFYGATEIYVREPAGHVIGFAEFDPQPEE